MAFSYGWRGPNIVKDGLVLYLDAGSPNSFYPLTAGTTWKDISGNAYNGALTNGPTYSTAGSGSIVFDGVNDYVNFGSSGQGLVRNATTLSLGAIVYCTGFSNQAGSFAWAPFYSIDRYQDGNNYRKFVFYLQTNNNIQSANCFFADGSGNSRTVEYATTVLNTLLFLFATVDSNNTTLYINGVQVNQTTGIIVNPNPPPEEFTLGSRTNSAYDGYFKGNIYSTQIYNRALTASEVLQNYNATKTRFGL